jgi:homoserine kinase
MIELKTKDARLLINKEIELEKAIVQWGNLAGFVASLYSKNYELLSKTIQDVIIEPQRIKLIPNYKEIVDSVSKYALGSGISGAGPSIFSICKGKKNAELVLKRIKEITVKKNTRYNLFLSSINTTGIKIIN